jgi:hypothetical protein
LLHVGRRYISAWKVAENPQIVYWGHSINQQGQATDLVVTESNKLKLHLKDGTQLNVEAVRGTGISQEQLRKSSPGFAGKTLPCDGGTTTNLASEQPT